MIEFIFSVLLMVAMCVCFVCVISSDSKCIRYSLLSNKSPPKLSSLERPVFIISQFLWVRNPGVAEPGACGSRSPTGCHQCVLWGYSQLKALFGEGLLASSPLWLWQDSVPRWLLAGGCPPIPCHNRALLTRWWLASQTRLQERARRGVRKMDATVSL